MRPERLPMAQPLSLKHWHDVHEARAPWVPDLVKAALDAWWLEVLNAQRLVDAGERVLPLLLAGPTRCGKTSSVCALARTIDAPVRRLDLSAVVGSFMGDTAKMLSNALDEMVFGPRAVWLVDEIDGIAQRRGVENSADKEKAHAVATFLARLERLPPNAPLVATSNTLDLIDRAVQSRFTVVEWPVWDDLSQRDREAFLASHGAPEEEGATSYADAVQRARARRVAAILASGEVTEMPVAEAPRRKRAAKP